MAYRRTIRITKVNLSQRAREQGSEEAVNQLENLFMNFEGFAKISTEKDRAAADAQADAQIAQAQKIQSHVKLLRFGSDFSNLVATEQNWLPAYRDSNGDLIIENPFTLRDQRNAARAMHSQISKQAGEDDSDTPDIFEEGDRD